MKTMKRNSAQEFVVGVSVASAVIGLAMFGIALGNSWQMETALSLHPLMSPALVCLASSCFTLVVSQTAMQAEKA